MKGETPKSDTSAATEQQTEKKDPSVIKENRIDEIMADMPMLIGIDEEGGIVSRLDNSTIPHDSVLPAADMNGDTATDSHAGAAASYHDMNRLNEIEFKPFQRLIDDGIPCVLVGHISLPEVTGNNTPATLSKEIVDILREDLNFDGVAITDAMNMGAIMDYYYNVDAAVLAVEAGMDILLMPPNLEHYQSALVEAVETGRIPESRIDESVKRILSLKYDSGIIE